MPVPDYLHRAFDATLPVPMNIHPSDGMFKIGAERHYRSVGSDAVKRIASILHTFDQPEPRRILDFGCGFGRVMRQIRAVFPNGKLFGADVMRPAVEFCAKEFGCEPLLSTPAIAKISFPAEFDLIWAGSVVTHIPEASARQLIAAFASHLSPGGIAVFTTHGRYAASAFASGAWTYQISEPAFRGIYADFVDDRYGYVTYEGQKQDYGLSLTPGSWVAREVSRHSDVCLVAFVERGWDNHQDVVAIRRMPPYREGVKALNPPGRQSDDRRRDGGGSSLGPGDPGRGDFLVSSREPG